MDRIPEVMHARREAELPADLDSLRCNPPEIGWRLHPDFRRQDLASEAALRMAAFAFDNLAAPELVAVRHPENVASARVMDRLRMRYRGFEVWYGKMHGDPCGWLRRMAAALGRGTTVSNGLQ